MMQTTEFGDFLDAERTYKKNFENFLLIMIFYAFKRDIKRKKMTI